MITIFKVIFRLTQYSLESPIRFLVSNKDLISWERAKFLKIIKKLDGIEVD